jgi:hypothetical protein
MRCLADRLRDFFAEVFLMHRARQRDAADKKRK